MPRTKNANETLLSRSMDDTPQSTLPHSTTHTDSTHQCSISHSSVAQAMKQREMKPSRPCTRELCNLHLSSYMCGGRCVAAWRCAPSTHLTPRRQSLAKKHTDIHTLTTSIPSHTDHEPSIRLCVHQPSLPLCASCLCTIGCGAPSCKAQDAYACCLQQ